MVTYEEDNRICMETTGKEGQGIEHDFKELPTE